MPDSRDADHAHVPLDYQLMIDGICDAFEARLRAGEDVSIEDQLAASPDAIRPHLLRELLKLELEYHRKREEDDYRRRFPEAATPVIVDAAAPTSDLTMQYQDTPISREDALPIIPGFEILSSLGKGGMGVVYKAREVKLGRIVAIKMIRGGEATALQLKRFAFEAEAAAQLDHPNILAILRVGEASNAPFICLKYLEGGSLADRLRAGVFCDPRKAAELMAPIARAVQHAHERGVLHRDLKPANILLDSSGKPHVADFGLARRLDYDAGHTCVGEVLGTMQYMSPEQARAERVLTVATDVYGLGTILYALLTGQPPFRGTDHYQTQRMVQEDAVKAPRSLNEAVPARLEAICVRCLEKQPTRRYASAAALAEDLERFLDGRPPAAQKSTVLQIIWSLVTGKKELSTLISLSAFWWLAGLVLVFNAAGWILGVMDAPLWSFWLLHGLGIVIFLSVNWWFHVLNDSLLTNSERQSMAIHIAYQLAVSAMLVIVQPADPNASVRELFSTWVPTQTVAVGLAWFAHGPIALGGFYLLGLAFFPLALLLRFWPPYAPLVAGSALSASLLLAGWMMRDMLNRTQARLERQD